MKKIFFSILFLFVFLGFIFVVTEKSKAQPPPGGAYCTRHQDIPWCFCVIYPDDPTCPSIGLGTKVKVIVEWDEFGEKRSIEMTTVLKDVR